eukprot:SAG11_NODE_585_length_8349_cov_38.121939_7_plen_164_part_00
MRVVFSLPRFRCTRIGVSDRVLNNSALSKQLDAFISWASVTEAYSTNANSRLLYDATTECFYDIMYTLLIAVMALSEMGDLCGDCRRCRCMHKGGYFRDTSNILCVELHCIVRNIALKGSVLLLLGTGPRLHSGLHRLSFGFIMWMRFRPRRILISFKMLMQR